MEKPILAKRIKEIRESLGYSLSAFSKFTNISESALKMYEQGLRNPPLDKLEVIAKELNVSTDYLLGISDFAAMYLPTSELETDDSVDSVLSQSIESLNQLNWLLGATEGANKLREKDFIDSSWDGFVNNFVKLKKLVEELQKENDSLKEERNIIIATLDAIYGVEEFNDKPIEELSTANLIRLLDVYESIYSSK